MAVTIPVVAPLVTSVVALAVHGRSRDFHVPFALQARVESETMKLAFEPTDHGL
jgi:hypothetical protein